MGWDAAGWQNACLAYIMPWVWSVLRCALIIPAVLQFKVPQTGLCQFILQRDCLKRLTVKKSLKRNTTRLGGVPGHTCDFNTREVETEGWAGTLRPPGLSNHTQSQKRRPKNQTKSDMSSLMMCVYRDA